MSQAWSVLSSRLYENLFLVSDSQQLETLDLLALIIPELSTKDDKNLVLLSLLKSYNKYIKRNFRNKVIQLLDVFFRYEDYESVAHAVKFVGAISNKRGSIAALDLEVLILWLSHWQGYSVKPELLEQITQFQFELLDQYLLTKGTKKQDLLKHVRNSLKQENHDIYSQVLAAKRLPITAQLLAYSLVAQEPGHVIADYCDRVLLNKNHKQVVFGPALAVFNRDFVAVHVTPELFQLRMLVALEKAMLMSEEFISTVVLQPLFLSLSFDSEPLLLSGAQPTKLFSKLLASVKSSNAAVRVSAASALGEVVTRTHGHVDKMVVEELVKASKSTSNFEIKILYFRILGRVGGADNLVIEALAPIVSKDQNELLLVEVVQVFVKSLLLSLSDGKLTDKEAYLKIVKAGINDKKIANKKAWYVGLGTNIAKIAVTSDVTDFFTDLVGDLELNLKAACAAPNKVPSVVVYTIWLLALSVGAGLDKHSVLKQVLVDTDILFNSKYYTKLSSDYEKRVFVEAIFASLAHLQGADAASGVAYVYACLSSSLDYRIRRSSLALLAEKSKVIDVKLVTLGLNEVLLKQQTEEISKLALNYSQVNALINALVTKSSRDHSQILMDLLVVEHSADGTDWIKLVQRCGIDPEPLVSQYGAAWFKKLIKQLPSIDPASDIYRSILKSINKLAFIKPSLIGPLIRDLVAGDLAADWLVGENELAIWGAKDGELVTDPLKKSGKKIEKNDKDYATKKWEEDLKKEIGKKAAVKLSKQDQLLVNEQLEKEKNIRHELDLRIRTTKLSIYLLQELCENFKYNIDNGYEYWYIGSIELLLGSMKKQFFTQLVPDSVTVFLGLSSYLNRQFAGQFQNIGVAILRVHEVPGVPENHLQEPLDSLILRILYNINFLTRNQQLDLYGFSYILPLLDTILINSIGLQDSAPVGNSEFVEENTDEQKLLISLNILSNHSELFVRDEIPRTLIVDTLVRLMHNPSKMKVVRECFDSLCKPMSSNISSQELTLIIQKLLTENKQVRNIILEQLDQEFLLEDLLPEDYVEIWILRFDENQANSELAGSIWAENSLEMSDAAVFKLIEYLDNPHQELRIYVAKSINEACSEALFEGVFSKLVEVFVEKSKLPPPTLDDFGLVIKSSSQQKDAWEFRDGVALAWKALTPLFTRASIITLFTRFILDAEPFLNDSNAEMLQQLQLAGVEIIHAHGLNMIHDLIKIFDAGLASSTTQIKQSIIIFYGAVAIHLDQNDPKLLQIISQLLKALDTPSETIQKTTAQYLPPLVRLLKTDLNDYFDQLFVTLYLGKTIHKRRGAAYGISSFVKGAGIKALFEYDIIRNLVEAAEDKRLAEKRQAASFVFECLSESLNSYFEPYVVEIIPVMLKSLGDQAPEVRAATDVAAKSIMKYTTPFGVKKLIPLAIDNLNEISWRSKKGSVELLGTMAYLDPTQLSSSLSLIVPEIVGVLNDSHKEVRKAADQALKRFGEVIRNPEIQKCVPTLIKAIGDPTKYTDEALDRLITTQFRHYIDGPSLALIIHVIHRGMLDRSATTKRKACQIVGNMSILVDAKDLVPYLANLINELEIAMVDPVPSTRATAARALGSLVEKLGEKQFPDLIAKLLDTLSDDQKKGDRLGAAQALAEVLAGLGVERMEEVLPVILGGAANARASVRAGFMPLLLYTPICFGHQFAPYIAKILPPILAGLADDDFNVSDVAIKAAKLIVTNYASKAVDLLLPELENGLSDANFKIRLSSVKLTGDLLFQLAGIKKNTDSIDDSEEQQDETVYVSEYSGALEDLTRVLGKERRDRVLSLLFICRSDTHGPVRNTAVEIWNPIVFNTPKTVKEILPTLASIIIRRLASPDDVQRRISASSLGDLVRRIGPSVLGQLLPTSEEIMISGDPDAKQGICIALKEIMGSTTENNIVQHQDVFISIVSEAIIDANEQVREAAASTFDGLLECIGKPAIDGVIPRLLALLASDDQSEIAIKALREIMGSKSDEIFPILIPLLLSPPMDSVKAQALGSVSEVAGWVLASYIGSIVNCFVDSLVDGKDISGSFTKFLLSITEDNGGSVLLPQLLSLMRSENKAKSLVVFQHLKPFFAGSSLDYSLFVEDIVQKCITCLEDENDDLVRAAWDALSELIKHQSKETLESLVVPAQQALSLTGTAGTDLKGFQINARGPNCVLPIFIQGLMYGNSVQKETSANAIADLVSKTTPLSLKPFFTTITGPLIRVIGERVSGDIKAAILSALIILLQKIPQFLRPFIPQLQRTFIKSLSDTSSETLRLRAAKALGSLIPFQPRVDPLANELINGIKATSDTGVKTAMLKALNEVASKVGNKLNQQSKEGIIQLIELEVFNVDTKLIVAYAKLIGSVSRILSDQEAVTIINEKILIGANQDMEKQKFAVLTLNAFLKDSPKFVFESEFLEDIVGRLLVSVQSSDLYINEQSILAIGKLLLLVDDSPTFELLQESIDALVEALTKTLASTNSVESRRLALVVIRTVSRKKHDRIVKPSLDVIAPGVFSCVRDLVIPVKLAAEKAYLTMFNLVDDESVTLFNEWFDSATKQLSTDGKSIETINGAVIQLRSISDYTKRVGSRLALIERERVKAGGDAEAMFSDLFEDEKEIWSVGGLEASEK